MLNRILTGVLILAFFIGCSSTKEIQRMTFPAAEYDKLPKAGTGKARVSGEAFFVSSWGDAKKCAGATIYLYRKTSYTEEWFRVSVLGGKAMSEWDPRVKEYNIYVKADAEGKFEFFNVSEGEYYVITWYYWDQPQRNAYGNVIGTKKEGGLLHSEVTIANGSNYKVILTNK